MAKTKYSHAFLVGSFNGELKPEQLDGRSDWQKELISMNGEPKRYERDRGYNGMCTLYYKAHIDAMTEADSTEDNRPPFLRNVHHYVHLFKEASAVTLHLKKGLTKTPFDYVFRPIAARLHFFPFGIVLLSIEFDDTGTELDDLTAAHNSLMGYLDRDCLGSEELKELLKPVIGLLQTSDSRLYKDGNKFKIFQTIKVEDKDFCDETLYEIASSSPIGCVHGGKRPDMQPSESYFRAIMDSSSVSAFDNWKGLALVDSFTMLGKEKSFDANDCRFLYFPLIYLRCIFEKTFCFSRNNAYRQNLSTENLAQEISDMERYYFYDNISYNFLPNMLYKAMAKGLGIMEEREEISKQIKEHAKEEKANRQKWTEDKRNLIGFVLAIFAIFSVAWDLCSMVQTARGGSKLAMSFIGLAVITMGVLGIYYNIKKHETK